MNRDDPTFDEAAESDNFGNAATCESSYELDESLWRENAEPLGQRGESGAGCWMPDSQWCSKNAPFPVSYD